MCVPVRVVPPHFCSYTTTHTVRVGRVRWSYNNSPSVNKGECTNKEREVGERKRERERERKRLWYRWAAMAIAEKEWDTIIVALSSMKECGSCARVEE